jgi:multidrug resistance protein, MATE family
MIFANATVPLAGVVDTAVIGAVGGKADLGGVALGATLFNLLYWSCYFLRMASTGLAAQAVGAGDTTELQRILWRSLGLAGALGVAAVALELPVAELGFALLQGGPQVEAAGRTYFLVRTLGAPAAYAGFALTGWLIGIGNTRGVLVVQVVFSAVNVLLDLWLVLGLGLGVAGVAAATAAADVVAAAVGGVLVWRLLRRQGVRREARAGLWHLPALRRLVVINTDMLLRSWALLAGFAWFTNTGARQGAAVLAGNHVLQQIVTVWAFVLDAFAFTAETAVGHAVGARSVTALRRAIRVTTELAVACGAAFMVLTLLGGPWVLDQWIADPEARAMARRFLPWCAVIPLVGAPAWQLDGVFVGAMRSGAMRNASIVAVAVYVGLDVVLTGQFGPDGMWLAFVLFYVARGAALLPGYRALERAAGARG